MSEAGRLFAEFWVNCGKCQAHDVLSVKVLDTGTNAKVRQEARKAGWRTTDRGWTCPACQGRKP